MSSRLRESRKSGREHKREDKYYTNGVRTLGYNSLDRESVEQPDWYHKQSLDDRCYDYRHASGYAASVVVMDEFVVGLLSRFLLSIDRQIAKCRHTGY